MTFQKLDPSLGFTNRNGAADPARHGTSDHEMHDGPFPGNHARYVLHSSVTLGREGGAA